MNKRNLGFKNERSIRAKVSLFLDKTRAGIQNKLCWLFDFFVIILTKDFLFIFSSKQTVVEKG